MEDWQKTSIAVLVALVLGLGGFGAGYLFAENRGPGAGGSDLIDEAYNKILDTAADPPSERELARGAVRGMVEVVKDSEDPYANFYNPAAYRRELQELTSGNFSGIGVSLRLERGGLTIVSVMPASPAKQEGLKVGDVITHVRGKKVKLRGADFAINRIKGEPGTQVSITIRRGKRSIDYRLTRAELELPQVSARMTKDGNGYLRVFGFARGTGRQAREEIERLIDEGADGILLDVRDNPGGLLKEAVNISSLFIEDGDVVIYREAEGAEEGLEAKGDAFEEIPVVMLVNGGSASASEVVAGAMQDTNRAQLIGTQTYGKASVQQVVPLLDESAVKLTSATYLTPDGRDINGTGIKPDVIVEDPSLQLLRAEELLENEIASAGEQG